MNITLLGGNLLLQKYRQINLADKADTLRILTLGGSQLLLLGYVTHLGLQQVTNREQSVSQLLLRKLTKEIALVFIGVGACQKFIYLLPVLHHRLLAAIVPRSDILRAHLESLFQKDIEFYLSITQHIGVGSATCAILGKHIINHPATILLREIDKAERDIEFFSHELGENLIVIPGAVTLQRTSRIVPVTHKETYHLVTLLFEQICRHRGINPSRKTHYNSCHKILL